MSTLKAARNLLKYIEKEKFLSKGFDPDPWYHGGRLNLDDQYIDQAKLGSVTDTPASRKGLFLTRSEDGAEGFAAHAGGQVRPLLAKADIPTLDWRDTGFPALRTENGQRALAGLIEDNPDIPAIRITGANDAMVDGANEDILFVRDFSWLRDPRANLEDLSSKNLFAGATGAAILGGAGASNDATASDLERLLEPGSDLEGIALSPASDLEKLVMPTSPAGPHPTLSEFQHRRSGKSSYWQGLRQQLSAVMSGVLQMSPSLTSAVAGVSALPWEQLDSPMQGIYGLAAGAASLAQGEDVRSALEDAALVAEQPIEVTAGQIGDKVFEKTQSPTLAAGASTAAQILGPI